MEKLDKVIAGLECCADTDRSCEGCPYEEFDYCEIPLMEDALDLLKDLKIAVTAAGVLERYRPAFEELAKGDTRQTNYRKIKNMGPLHFADWIMRTVAPCECCDKQGVCGIPEDEVNDEYCAEHILVWLMQEAENE